MTTAHPSATNSRRRLPVAVLAITAMLALGGAPAEADASQKPPAGDTLDSPLAEFVASLEGGWQGQDNDTPFGKMPFALLFEWVEDGSLRARSTLNRQTYIELRFERTADGTWLLHEEAAMEGLGTQSYSLVPAPKPSAAGVYRWIWEQDPEFLSIEAGSTGDTMTLDVLLRGKPHVAFRLDRQPRTAWAEMKLQMLAQEQLSPDEGTSIREVVSRPPQRLESDDAAKSRVTPGDPLEKARRDIADSPEDARAHLALARLLGEAINENPANGPRYAFEMLSALQSAVALDNQLVEAYHYLVGYYLNAPPIAGGSLEKAEETAKALVEFDPEGGQQLMAEVAARREAATSGGRGR